MEPDPTRIDIQSLLGRVAIQWNIQSPSIDDFVEPVGERLLEDQEALEEQVFKEILEAYNNNESAEDQEEGIDKPVTKVTLEQAIEAMQTRIQYEEQSGDGEGDKLLQLERDLRLLQLKKGVPKVKQTSLFNWLHQASKTGF